MLKIGLMPALSLVALRKESVDRNVINEKPVTDQDGSLSARRAWIEIQKQSRLQTATMSLSARRAWIEIASVRCIWRVASRRSPQGERG